MAVSDNRKTAMASAKTAQPKNGYSGGTHKSQYDGQDAQATLLTSVDKGGMRGIALILTTIAEISLKNEATSLAKKYYNTNKQDYDFFKNTHQAPIQQTVSEAMSDATNPKYSPDLYSALPGGIARSALLDKQWFEARRRTHRYAIGLGRRIDFDFAFARLHAVIGGWNLANRYEITYADEHNNRRFDRKIEVANIGLGVGNVVRENLSASVQNLSSAYDNLGNMVSTIGNGLAAHSGYKAGRQATQERFDNFTAASKTTTGNKITG